MAYYDNQNVAPWQQTPSSQLLNSATWDNQISGGRSDLAIASPQEESAAFRNQFEEIEKAQDNLQKSAKMFTLSGRLPHRMSHGGPGARHSPSDYGSGDVRFHGPPSTSHNYYANHRHQPQRTSIDVEPMVLARRKAAARERDLRHLHHQQQLQRYASEASGYSGKLGHGMPSGFGSGSGHGGPGMGDEMRRDIAYKQQREAIFREGPHSDVGRYRDVQQHLSGNLGVQVPSIARGPSPHMYDNQDQQGDGNKQSRADSTSSLSSNPTTNRNGFDNNPPAALTMAHTTASSPGASPPRHPPQSAPIGTKPLQTSGLVTPIGTRPGAGSASQPTSQPSSHTPIHIASPSVPASLVPLTEDKTGPGNGSHTIPSATAPANGTPGLAGWGNRGGVWGNGSGMQTSAHVWG